MNIKTIERRDVAILGRPKHFEFTVILENGDRVRVNAHDLIDFSRCQTSILEQAGYLLDPLHSWFEFLREQLA